MISTESHILALREAIARLEQEKAEIDNKIAHVRKALLALVGENGHVRLSVEDRAPYTALSIGDDKLEHVRQYFRDHADQECILQADISRALEQAHGMNSGSVSIGVRRLEAEGSIEALPKVRGANAWRIV